MVMILSCFSKTLFSQSINADVFKSLYILVDSINKLHAQYLIWNERVEILEDYTTGESLELVKDSTDYDSFAKLSKKDKLAILNASKSICLKDNQLLIVDTLQHFDLERLEVPLGLKIIKSYSVEIKCGMVLHKFKRKDNYLLLFFKVLNSSDEYLYSYHLNDSTSKFSFYPSYLHRHYND